MPISNIDIKSACELCVEGDFQFDNIGLINSTEPNLLSFIDEPDYLNYAQKSKTLSGLFITRELSEALPNLNAKKIICDDPRYCFYKLYNFLGKRNYVKTPSIIDPSANIHPTAYISEFNVRIGKNTIVNPNATILPDVVIGADCVIGAGTVLGCDDAEIKVTKNEIFRVFHDGELRIGDRVEIGANNTIDKGFSFRHTVIGNDTKLANNTFIGHGAHIGESCLLLCCTVLGSANIEDQVRINPNAIISNQVRVGKGANVSLGAVVVRDVPSGQTVSGNFAVEHHKFLYGCAKIFGLK